MIEGLQYKIFAALIWAIIVAAIVAGAVFWGPWKTGILTWVIILAASVWAYSKDHCEDDQDDW
jgi:fatty acid desaturase